MDLNELSIGIEFGSTRIKAVIVNKAFEIIASSQYQWENKLVDGVWTYGMDEAVSGLQSTFKDLMSDFKRKYSQELTHCGMLGISGMMHGYLVFDKDGNQLAPFRTWRNTMTEEASDKLTELFGFHIPQRWTVAHIYQSIIEKRPEVGKIAFATTLAGYIHYLLTGKKVVGVGEASGIFPIDEAENIYNPSMLKQFNDLIGSAVPYKLEEIIPHVLTAGENAGYLTERGALLLDPTGTFRAGVPLCPPEGDMGTGMVATNSCRVNTGNASIGTSSNVTVTTGKYVKSNTATDLITSPSGLPACLIHVNNGTTDINNWIGLFDGVLKLFGKAASKEELFNKLFAVALDGDETANGLYHFNFDSGETIISINEGRPMFIRKPDSKMDIGDFMRSNLYSVFCVIRYGLDILRNDGVNVSKITGHGGFFKTEGVGMRIMADALNCDVETLSSAGEGGPYGMALLASYALSKEKGELLEDYLDNKVFVKVKSSSVSPSEKGTDGFNKYYKDYVSLLSAEKEAIKQLH